MKTTRWITGSPRRAAWATLLAISAACLPAGRAWGQLITYQGQLKQNGTLVNAPRSMSFTLWDWETGGNQVGTTVNLNLVPVVDGVFTVELYFGENVFNDHPRWVQVRVESDVLAPRQPETPAPVALFALETRPTPSPWYTAGNSVYNVGANIGIGTASPGALLDISNSLGAERIRLSGRGRASNLTSTEGVSLLLGPNDSASNRQLWVGVSDALTANTGNGVLRRMPGGSAGVGKMDAVATDGFGPQNLVLQSTGGNLGVGTATPGQKLSVAGVIESTTGGFKFPDGSIQASAYWQRSGANISYSAGTTWYGRWTTPLAWNGPPARSISSAFVFYPTNL